MSLFDQVSSETENEKPLAEILRPKTFQEVVGQEHLLNDTGFLGRILKQQKPVSILLWGPPGCGKTTIARLYAQAFDVHFVPLSAVFSGVKDVKQAVEEAKDRLKYQQQRTLLFIDEIHRFNKAQQDAFLPYVEDGTLILVGATTENPSFEVNAALLSRMQVLELKNLEVSDLTKMLDKAKAHFGFMPLDEDGQNFLVQQAQGDGRYLLGLLESVYASVSQGEDLSLEDLGQILGRRAAVYDKSGEGHFSLISAFHKSLRGSDPDAALYWMARMLDAGEDPMYIGRRMLALAAEDVGMADPQALIHVTSAVQAYQMLGMPEGRLPLANAAVYLALAPKSNAAYMGITNAFALAKQTGHLSPPKWIVNAPTKLMKKLDYGKDYIYDHDTEYGFSGQNYFPQEIERPVLYKPIERGFEREMKKRYIYFDQLREKLQRQK